MSVGSPVEYINALRDSGGMSAVTADQVLVAYNASLWHQLTVVISDWFKDVESGIVVRADLAEFYRKFILKFESKLNPILLVSLVGTAAEQMCKSTPPTEDEVNSAVALLNECSSTETKKKLVSLSLLLRFPSHFKPGHFQLTVHS